MAAPDPRPLNSADIKRNTAAACALLIVALTSFWRASDERTLLPTIDAHIREMRVTTSESATPARWDPYEFGGRPHIAEPQTFLYPPALRTWVSDASLTVASYVLHVWLAGFAVFVAARRMTAGRLTAVVLAVAYMLATVLAFPQDRVSAEVVFRFAWLPLLGVATLAFVDRPAAWAPRITLVAIGVVSAAAGSPRTQAYGAITLLGTLLLSTVWAAPGRRRHVAIHGTIAAALMVTISAPASFPTVRLWRSTLRSGGLMSSEPFNGSWRADGAERVGINPELAQALRQLRPARVISACPEVVDAVHLRALGVRSVGGYGGVFPAGYARFVNLIRNQTPTAPLPYTGVGGAEPRADLLQFLDASYLISCEPARGQFVRSVDAVRIYRTGPALGTAFWTCYPNHIGRKEVEYRLATRRYDRTLSLRDPGPKINVRWAPDVDDAAREAAEARFHLAQEGPPDGRTRRYELLDSSRENVEAMLTNPAVEDTAGLNRETLVFDKVPEVHFRERATDWLIGLEPCPEVRSAAVVKWTDDGQVVVDIDAPAEGVVLFSETYYRTRTAQVDGQPAAVLEVNLAFAAVPVSAGRHRVALGLGPDTRGLDWAVALLAVMGLVTFSWTGRRRP